MKQLNVYFFGEEEICFSDFAWFYGVLTAMLLLTAVVCINALTQL